MCEEEERIKSFKITKPMEKPSRYAGKPSTSKHLKESMKCTKEKLIKNRVKRKEWKRCKAIKAAQVKRKR